MHLFSHERFQQLVDMQLNVKQNMYTSCHIASGKGRPLRNLMLCATQTAAKFHDSILSQENVRIRGVFI